MKDTRNSRKELNTAACGNLCGLSFGMAVCAPFPWYWQILTFFVSCIGLVWLYDFLINGSARKR
jgi:hypothetical protein